MKTVVVLVLCIGVLYAKIESKTKNNHHSGKEKTIVDGEKTTAPSVKEEEDPKKAFLEEFEARRSEHKMAIQSMVGIEDRSKQRLFVEDVVKNMKKILEENKDTIERIGHPAEAPYPHDSETLKESLAKVMENIALFSDVAMRFPKLLAKSVKKDRKLKAVVIWAYQYADKSGLIDEETHKSVKLMAQQLEFVPREEGFYNPFDKEAAKEDLKKSADEKERKRKEEKSKKTKHAKVKKPDSKKVKTEL